MTTSREQDLMRMAIDAGKNSCGEPGKISPRVGASIFLPNGNTYSAFRGQVNPGDHAEYTLFEKVLSGQDV